MYLVFHNYNFVRDNAISDSCSLRNWQNGNWDGAISHFDLRPFFSSLQCFTRSALLLTPCVVFYQNPLFSRLEPCYTIIRNLMLHRLRHETNINLTQCNQSKFSLYADSSSAFADHGFFRSYLDMSRTIIIPIVLKESTNDSERSFKNTNGWLWTC